MMRVTILTCAVTLNEACACHALKQCTATYIQIYHHTHLVQFQSDQGTYGRGMVNDLLCMNLKAPVLRKEIEKPITFVCAVEVVRYPFLHFILILILFSSFELVSHKSRNSELFEFSLMLSCFFPLCSNYDETTARFFQVRLFKPKNWHKALELYFIKGQVRS